MARYIDMESKEFTHIVSNLEPRWKPMGEFNGEDFKELDSIAEAFLALPTADVVPTSMVDETTKQFLALHDAYQEQKAEIDKIKVKVAREIFADIEKVIGNKYDYYVFDNREIEGIEQDAIIAFADAMRKHFAKLKQKYRETQETEEKHFTPEDVRKMTPIEVKNNYKAIVDSMNEWK